MGAYEGIFGPARRTGPWTDAEVEALRLHYPTGGGEAAAQQLPGRSKEAVYAMAKRYNLKAPTGRAVERLRVRVPEHIDAQVRAFYTAGGPATRGAFAEFAKRIGRSRNWVRDRALRMGLAVPRFKEAPWTKAEDAIVEQQAHKVPAIIQKHLKSAGYARSEAAIAIHVKRQAFDRIDDEHMTGRTLASLMGVDSKVVTRWVDSGDLRATLRGTKRTAAQHGDMLQISRKDFRAWAKTHIHEVAKHSRKADQLWLVEILLGI